MKRSVLFTAVAALFLTASCAGAVTPTKREHSIRQGWDNEEHKSLYGDAESVLQLPTINLLINLARLSKLE